MRRSQAEARKIQEEINQLDKENQELQNHVKDLKTDPSTMECIARENFGLARPGSTSSKPSQDPPTRPIRPRHNNTTTLFCAVSARPSTHHLCFLGALRSYSVPSVLSPLTMTFCTARRNHAKSRRHSL